jgi:hypothetical protein
VGPDNYPFITYVPYFTHSVRAEGRACDDCHGTEAAEAIAAGKTFQPAWVKDGELSFYSGVIPLAPQQLDWPFLEKKGGKWVPFTPKNKPLIQLGVYAEPLSAREIKKMKLKRR